MVSAAASLSSPALHHFTPISMLHCHNSSEHLSYCPIIYAALSFGWRGGLTVFARLSQMSRIIPTCNFALNCSEDLICEMPPETNSIVTWLGSLTGENISRLRKATRVASRNRAHA
jgi:hypothetical protein